MAKRKSQKELLLFRLPLSSLSLLFAFIFTFPLSITLYVCLSWGVFFPNVRFCERTLMYYDFKQYHVINKCFIWTENYPDLSFEIFGISQCRHSEECLINKGHDIQIETWAFKNSKNPTTTLRLSVLIGYIDPISLRNIVSELPIEEPDLCQVEKIRQSFPPNNPKSLQCLVGPEQYCQIPSHNLYVSRLLPLVSVVEPLFIDMFSLVFFSH